eukprot:403359696
MQGVPSVIRLKQSKPNQDVRNLFDRKTYMKDNSEHDNLDPPSPRLQNINSHRIVYDDDEVQENKKLVSKKLSKIHDDENVQQAIDLRNQKQKHTDFFFKLAELKERIEVYNEVFRSKKPKFLHNDAKSMKQRMKEHGNGSRLQSPFGSANPKLPRQSSMTNGSNRKQRKSIAHTQSHQQVKLNIKDHEEPKKVENMNIIEAGEDEEQNSPTNKEKNLEQQDNLDLQNNLRIGSANASSKNSFQVQEKSNTIDNEKASLPKIVQTEQRLTTQHKQSMEKALETKKKQDQQTTNRLNAIEKKMPALNTSLSQQQFKPASKFSSTLYSANNNHQTRTNNLGIQNSNTNHLENMQGNASTGGLNRFINQSNNIMNRNRSQNNLKLFNQQEIDKNQQQKANSSTTTNKEAKTLLQSQSYADFKSIYKKDFGGLQYGKNSTNTLAIGSSKALGQNTVTTSKDRSMLMKSVYETNLFKEQFNSKGNLNTSSGPFNTSSYNMKKKLKQGGGRSKSPNPPKIDTTIVKEEGAENDPEILGLSPIINSNPKTKKLPPVSSQSKSNLFSASQPQFQIGQIGSTPVVLNDKKIKQISNLYNQNTSGSNFQQILNNSQSNQTLLAKIKKAKKQKKSQKKSPQINGTSSITDTQNNQEVTSITSNLAVEVAQN